MAQHGTTATTDPVEALVAAIGRLGQATPAEIAADAGVAYSTTNKKLRILKETGRAETFDGPDNHTLWRLTNAVGAADTRTGQPDPDGSQATATAPPAEQAAAAHFHRPGRHDPRLDAQPPMALGRHCSRHQSAVR